jgi:hypothetical protein
MSSNSPDSQGETRVERDPAIILFRDDVHKRLLVVFLVGETPTRGVNKTALRDALDEISCLSRWKLNDSPPPQYLTDGIGLASHFSAALTFGGPCMTQSRGIRIVGPSFSGSAASMRNTLTEWLGTYGINPPKICIVSGTATAIDNNLEIDQTDGGQLVEFYSMQVPDSAIWAFAL